VDGRGFLNDVKKVGIGLGGNRIAARQGGCAGGDKRPGEEAGETHQKREAVRSNRSQTAMRVVIWAEQGAEKPVWPVIPRSPDLIETTRNLALR
jgi:hypothetical protein